MLNVVTLRAVLLNVIMLNVVPAECYNKSVMLNEIMLSVISLNVILLNVVAPFAIPHNLSNIGLHYFKEVKRIYSDCQLPEFSTKFSLARILSNADSVMKSLQKNTNYIYFEICLLKVIN
jgi:hypothetical protein